MQNRKYDRRWRSSNQCSVYKRDQTQIKKERSTKTVCYICENKLCSMFIDLSKIETWKATGENIRPVRNKIQPENKKDDQELSEEL